MKCDVTGYHPTLWRTCRTLAHVKRLACLKVVLGTPSSTVGEIAERLRVPINQASLFLRALQARGLILAQRQGRYVRYAAVPDPLVSSARPLLHALRQALLQENRPEDYVKRTLTGFTHPRRLVILSYLQQHGPCSDDTLAAATGIRPPALTRHLKKLAARDIVHSSEDKWQKSPPPNALAKTLLALCLPEKASCVSAQG